MDYVVRWTERTELAAGKLVKWLGISSSKYYSWKERYGKVTEHNGQVPRDWWLEAWEKAAILAYQSQHQMTQVLAKFRR